MLPSGNNNLWPPGERELYYDLPTDEPVTGLVDGCSMFINLSYRRLYSLVITKYVSSQQYPVITHLHLQSNKLEVVPDDVFNNLKSLSYLDLRNNNLTEFPTSCENHECLETLLVQDNLIEEFPIEIGSMPALETLGVEYNPLKFPSFAVLKQWRSKKDAVDFFQRCWKEQTTNVPAVVKRKKRKVFKPVKPKFIKVRDHSEIACALEKSNDLKDKSFAKKIKNEFQNRQKILDRNKAKDVLEAWQDRYRKYKDVERSVIIHPPPYDIDERYKKILRKTDQAKKDHLPLKGAKYRLNLDREIQKVKDTLAEIGSETIFRDSVTDMGKRLNEIRAIRNLQKRIEHLKHRS